MYAEPVILPKMENDVVGQVGCKFLIALGWHTEGGWGEDVHTDIRAQGEMCLYWEFVKHFKV
jgi:hypothetical protein